MKKAAIFDLDGLLVNSEILWEEAQTRIFSEMGIHLHKTDFYQLKGLRITESVLHLYKMYPWEGRTIEQMRDAIVEEVDRLLHSKVELMPGAKNALELCKSLGMKIALASSSDWQLINSAIECTAIKPYFEAITSGEDELLGKPHPNIFLRAAKALEVDAKDVIVFEDAFHGVIAAKAARMSVIAVPDGLNRKNPHFIIADYTLNSLEELNSTHLQ